jgi:hypothetical protein
MVTGAENARVQPLVLDGACLAALHRHLFTGGAVFGTFTATQRGVGSGITAGVLFGLVCAAMGSGLRAGLGRVAARHGVTLAELARKSRIGAAPESPAEAAALRRLVNHRRRALAGRRRRFVLMAMLLLAPGVLATAAGALMPGSVLTVVALISLIVLARAQRAEPERISRIEKLLDEHPPPGDGESGS